MMNILRTAAAPLVLLAALAACTSPSTQSSCDGIVMPGAIPAPPAMLSPAPGTTGLPTSGVVVEVSYAPPSGSLRLVAQGSGTTLSGGPFTPVPSPPPGAPVTGAVTSALPALAPHTTYTVFVDAVYPPLPRCYVAGLAGPTSFDAGTLATQ
jgi:hypothetical protein